MESKTCFDVNRACVSSVPRGLLVVLSIMGLASCANILCIQTALGFYINEFFCQNRPVKCRFPGVVLFYSYVFIVHEIGEFGFFVCFLSRSHGCSVSALDCPVDPSWNRECLICA